MPNKYNYTCPKCGKTDLNSETVELVKFEHHIVNDVYVSEKVSPIDLESWTLYCNNQECENNEGFPESDLYEVEWE